MEVKENNTMSISTELIKFVTAIIALSAGVLGAVQNPRGLGILWIVLALFGFGGLSFLVYQAIKRAKQKRRSIRFREQDLPTGFNEALAYTTRDAHRFYGRQNDTFNILNRIDREDYRLGVLHGESGVGKTSIIQAGLIPELEKRNLKWSYVSLNHLPKTIDSVDDLVDFLLSRVGKKFNLSGATNLKDMAKQLTAESKTGTVLFLDQFEQIFDRTHEEARQEFAQRLEECCRSVDLFKIVIVVRGDYFGRVYNMFKSMIEPNATSYLAKFNKIQAREVIRKSAGYDENLHITSPDDPLLGFEDDILADLQDSDRRVHPVELSLICSTIMKQNGKLDRAAYLDGGRKQGWLNRYLDDVLKGQPQQASLQLLSGLIDVDKAATLTAKEISERSGPNLPETKGLLNYFLQSRLIVEEGENDEQKYRLAHEYLIASIRLRCGDVETPVQKYNRLLESRVQAWERENHNPHHLLKGKNLYKVRFQLKEHLGWDAFPVKSAFIRKSLTRYLAIMLVYLLSVTVLAGLIGYGWHTLREDARITKYLTALKYKSENDLIKIEPELVELSREGFDVKMKVLEDVLSETKGCYNNGIMPVLCHALIGISTKNRDRLVEFIIWRLEKSADSGNQKYSVDILGKIGSKKTVEPLIKLLDISMDSDVLRRTVGALGKIGDERSVDPLIKLLQKSTDPDIQRIAAWALGEIGKVKAVEPLINLLNRSKNTFVQINTALALGKIANEKVVDPLIKLFNNNTDSGVQINTVWALGEIANDKAIDQLIIILENSKNISVQKSTAWALGKIRSEKVIGPLIKLIENSTDPDVNGIATVALGETGNEKAVDPLIKLLEKSTDSSVQGSAAKALGEIGNEKAIDPLIKLVENCTDPDVNGIATVALGKIGNEKAVDLLIKLLEKNTNSYIQGYVVGALGESRNKKAIDPIIKLLEKSTDASVQIIAAYALRKIGNEKTVAPLVKILETSTDPDIQIRVAGALGEIGPPARSALSVLSRLFEKEKDYEKKYLLIRAMLKIDPSNRKYYTIIIEGILPHPFAVSFNYLYTSDIKQDIVKTIGEVAGKEAAGEKLDFGGDMWKMLEWWEKFKEK